MKLSWTLDLEAVLETWHAFYKEKKLEVCYLETDHRYEWQVFIGRDEVGSPFKSKGEAIEFAEEVGLDDDEPLSSDQDRGDYEHNADCHWDPANWYSECTCSD